MEEDKIPYGASGLTDEDIEYHNESRRDIQVKPLPLATSPESNTAAIRDDSIEIVKALAECGLDSDMMLDPIFVDTYNQVVSGPGRNWTPEKRTLFTLQSMNRMGAYEPAVNRKSNSSSPVDTIIEKGKSSVNSNPADDIAIWGYHHLDRNEIIGNLIILGGVLGFVIIAATATYFCISFNFSEGAEVGGTISLIAITAAVIRLATKWHHRFSFRYRMVRLVVCFALLFSTAVWWAAKGLWQIACLLFNTTIDIIPFGISAFVALCVLSLVSHVKLCHTYEPRRARILGWIEALALTFAIGAFLFSAVHKP